MMCATRGELWHTMCATRGASMAYDVFLLEESYGI